MNHAPIISFRVATVADADSLAVLASSAFREAYQQVWEREGLEQYINNHFTPAQMREELQQAASTFMLIYRHSAVAGYAKLYRSANPPALVGSKSIQIHRFYLLSAYYGQGIGNQLMQQCLETARQEGYDTIWLAVWPENTRAVRFYQRWGFEVTGTYPFHNGEEEVHDWLMQKKLC